MQGLQGEESDWLEVSGPYGKLQAQGEMSLGTKVWPSQDDLSAILTSLTINH